MNEYTQTNPPKRGNALKIWRAFTAANYHIRELHYNSNLWGRAKESGWGTWAIDADCPNSGETLFWCGVIGNKVYIQSMCGKYDMKWV